MLHIRKNEDGTFWINLEVSNDSQPVMTFSGTFQRVNSEDVGKSDNTLSINVPTLGDSNFK